MKLKATFKKKPGFPSLLKDDLAKFNNCRVMSSQDPLIIYTTCFVYVVVHCRISRICGKVISVLTII